MKQNIFEIGIDLESKPQKTLFHYTSHASLIKIIETGKLFATGIRYLNDSSEFRYTELLFAKQIDEHLSRINTDAKDWFLWIRKSISFENELRSAAYVTCFTEEKDLLSQWRAYCPQGAGYSIGLSPEILIASSKQQKFELVKCIYDEEKQKEAISNVIEQIEQEFLSQLEHATKKEIDDIRNQNFSEKNVRMWGKVLDTIKYMAPFFKHPAFKEEQEWRAISRDFSFFNSEPL